MRGGDLCLQRTIVVLARLFWMQEERDSLHHSQIARKARQLAAGHADPDVRRYLREMAVKHDRRAKELARLEAFDIAPPSQRITQKVAKLLGLRSRR